MIADPRFALRSLVGSAVLFAAMSGMSIAGDDLTIASWGGAYQESQRLAYFTPFAAEGNKITEIEYGGEIDKLRAMVESGNVTWDVIDLDTQTALAACAQGILEVIDWNRLGLDRARFVGGNLQQCAMPTIVYSTVVAYNTTVLTDPPRTIADFFDLKKYPGKRGLQKNPFVALEWALMADSVSPGDVYKVLATPEGVEQALKKLDTIKKDIIWWEVGAQPVRLLADGEVVMTSAWNNRVYNAIITDKEPFAILWDQQGLDWDWWSIPKGTAKLEAAYRFIAFASDPVRMAEQTRYITYGPVNLDALQHVDPSVLPYLPTAEANMKNALILNPQFWSEHGDQLRDRFNSWLAQ
jgi:putative spermidine/putrescine transport system substrate-binding protein